ncbi:MAG: Rpn family recombination-promoting nuclease/putative transposase [Coriobacteriales bacterium]|nr:Rpn family recombination-promoting nuclease/putative transposase [Coriobacteriales bacterium]
MATSSFGQTVVLDDTHAQRQYKNNLFADYFSEKERLIEVYNALSGEDFPEDAKIGFETLANVLYIGGYNDIAFTIEDRYVVLIEHQSTINENMPLRLLHYISRVYESMVESDELYRRELRRIPTPDFIVIYNGRDPYPDKKVLRLSDAFMVESVKPTLELTATVYNIAAGHNTELLSESQALSDYAVFVSMVENYRADGLSLDDAITKAIQECKKHGIMAAYLESRGSEVLNMLITEWNMEDALRVRGEEERLIGERIGEKRGEARTARTNATRMKADGLDARLIAKYTGLKPEEVASL